MSNTVILIIKLFPVNVNQALTFLTGRPHLFTTVASTRLVSVQGFLMLHREVTTISVSKSLYQVEDCSMVGIDRVVEALL